jgi:hypothetical protein
MIKIRIKVVVALITSLFKSRKTIVVGNFTPCQQHGYALTTKTIDMGYITGDNFT